MRRYTPITSNFDVGMVKFVIKAYPPNEHFPRGGKMSQHLAEMSVGETIDMRGPVGEFEYLSNGKVRVWGKPRSEATSTFLFAALFAIRSFSSLKPMSLSRRSSRSTTMSTR